MIDRPKTVNAFAMAGGKIGVYSGLWRTLPASEEELAHVLAHEIAHARAAHTQERISIAMSVDLATSVAAGAVSRDPAMRDLALSGLELAAALAITLWGKMARQGERLPEFLSTHPAPENRRERLRALAEKLAPVYREALHAQP